MKTEIQTSQGGQRIRVTYAGACYKMKEEELQKRGFNTSKPYNAYVVRDLRKTPSTFQVFSQVIE